MSLDEEVVGFDNDDVHAMQLKINVNLYDVVGVRAVEEVVGLVHDEDSAMPQQEKLIRPVDSHSVQNRKHGDEVVGNSATAEYVRETTVRNINKEAANQFASCLARTCDPPQYTKQWSTVLMDENSLNFTSL